MEVKEVKYREENEGLVGEGSVIVKECCFSCNLFSGYSCELEITEYDTLITVAQRAKNHLINFLRVFKLESLIALCLAKNYHIHDYTIETLKKASHTIWICSHQEQETNTEVKSN